MATIDARQIVDAYLAALGDGDLEGVLAQFAEDGDVVSPLYGTLPAREFFTGLFAVTSNSTLTLKTVFASVDGGPDIAAAFDYDWELANGERVTFPVVDTFRIDPEGRIQRMVIHYDAGGAREVMD